jgi:hypothetical protein
MSDTNAGNYRPKIASDQESWAMDFGRGEKLGLQL